MQRMHCRDKTEEPDTAGVVMVRTFNFDWLEAWPEAFWTGGLWHRERQGNDQQQHNRHTQGCI